MFGANSRCEFRSGTVGETSARVGTGDIARPRLHQVKIVILTLTSPKKKDLLFAAAIGGAPLLALFEKGPSQSSHQGIGQAADGQISILTLFITHTRARHHRHRPREV